MKRNFVHVIIAFIVLSITCPLQSYAQKKGSKQAKAAAKPAAPKEDFTEWIENPVCKVLIFDSLVTDKENAINSILLPAHVGRLFKEQATGHVVYENEFADQRVFAAKDEASGHQNIFRQTLLGTQWSKPEPIVINGNFKDIINPFPMPDGQTLYFAATEAGDEESEPSDKFSLYTTTLDTETNTYRTPQRLPYPFTSKSDDLWYIEDETDSLAWFVSARNQPDGKVCVYTMRIHEPWVYYDSEETSPQKLKKYALIERIADTWPSTRERNKVYAEVTSLLDGYGSENTPATVNEVYFVVNNETVYRDMADFSSEDSRTLYKQLVEQQNKVAAIKRQLDEYRRLYHNASYENRSRLGEVISDSERQLATATSAVRSLTISLRKQENEQ